MARSIQQVKFLILIKYLKKSINLKEPSRKNKKINKLWYFDDFLLIMKKISRVK